MHPAAWPVPLAMLMPVRPAHEAAVFVFLRPVMTVCFFE
jgi:hypothetical protein